MNSRTTFTQPPSREQSPGRQTLTRRLSREETFHLADTAFKKSSMREIREDLRLRLGHSQMLELLLHELALSDNEYSPPSSPPLLASSPSSPHTSSKSSQSSNRKSEPKSAKSANLGAEYAESSPRQTTISWDDELPHHGQKSSPAKDEYGFAYDDDEEDDDMGGLSLCRTSSHRPSR